MNARRTCLFLLVCTPGITMLRAQDASSAPTEQDALTIAVDVRFGNAPLETDTRWYTTAAGDSVQISRFQCYLSGFAVVYTDGSVATEPESYHLVDASDPETLQFSLKGVPAGAVSELRFSIGVDSAKSVSGAFGGDLDPVNGMYWAWNSGYINARLEGTSPSCATFHHAFEFHIGGYLPHQRTLRKVSFPLTSEPTSGITLIADVSSWFDGIALATTNRVVVPGPEAVKMADSFVHLFNILQP